MNPQLAFLALSKAENLQILSCLRENEQRFSTLSASPSADFQVCLDCLRSKTGLSCENLSQGLTLLVKSGLINIKRDHQKIYYQRNENNLSKLAELLDMKSLLVKQTSENWFSQGSSSLNLFSC